MKRFEGGGHGASHGKARCPVMGGGGRITNRAVTGELEPVSDAGLDADGVIKLSAGKKRHALIRGITRS